MESQDYAKGDKEEKEKKMQSQDYTEGEETVFTMKTSDGYECDTFCVEMLRLVKTRMVENRKRKQCDKYFENKMGKIKQENQMLSKEMEIYIAETTRQLEQSNKRLKEIKENKTK